MPSDIERIAEEAFMRATRNGSASINAVHTAARAVLRRTTRECDGVIAWSRKHKESQQIELGAARCQHAITALGKK